MSAPLVPSPLDFIGRGRFAFYPSLALDDPNTWILGTSSWSEVQVINAKTGREIWVPRRYIGAVSDNQEALMVGLTQPLDLRKGKLVPRANCRVIEMPLPCSPHQESLPHERPAPVIGIRLEKKAQSTFQSAPFRVSICVLFVVGLLALVASASR